MNVGIAGLLRMCRYSLWIPPPYWWEILSENTTIVLKYVWPFFNITRYLVSKASLIHMYIKTLWRWTLESKSRIYSKKMISQFYYFPQKSTCYQQYYLPLYGKTSYWLVYRDLRKSETFSRDEYQLNNKVLSSRDVMNYHVIIFSRSILSW